MEIELECPHCQRLVPYEDWEVDDGGSGYAMCPKCGESCEESDLFET